MKILPVEAEFFHGDGHTYIHTYTYIHIHKFMHTYILACMHKYIYINSYIHTYLHACIHTYIHKFIHTYLHACKHTYIHTYIHINSYIHNCMHAYIHTYINIYIKYEANSRFVQFYQNAYKRSHYFTTVCLYSHPVTTTVRLIFRHTRYKFGPKISRPKLP